MQPRWSVVLAISVELFTSLFLVRPSIAVTLDGPPTSTSSIPDRNNRQLRPPEAARMAAQDGLKILKQFGKGDDVQARKLGFLSSSEKALAQLDVDNALPIFIITPKELSSSPNNLANFLHPPKVFIYPVTVKGKLRSSLTVKQSHVGAAKWRAGGFGPATLIELIDKYRKGSGANVLVRIPGLSRHFLGVLRPNELLLTPIVTEPSLGLVAGKPVTADKVFGTLKPQADAFGKAAEYKRRGVMPNPDR